LPEDNLLRIRQKNKSAPGKRFFIVPDRGSIEIFVRNFAHRKKKPPAFAGGFQDIYQIGQRVLKLQERLIVRKLYFVRRLSLFLAFTHGF
jgi:hypothetical protein